MQAKGVVEAAGVAAGNTVVEWEAEIVDAVALEEGGQAADLEVIGIDDLGLLEFDQALGNKGLSEGQEGSGSEKTDLEVELHVVHFGG